MLQVSAISLYYPLRKWFFNIFSPCKCMGAQIWPCHKKVKSQPTTIFWTNLVYLEFPMLYTKIQPQSFLGSGEDDFFYHIWAWWPSCSMGQNHSYKLSIPFRQKAPCEIWGKLLKWFPRRGHLKTRWRLWWLSWISDCHNLSSFLSIIHAIATV